MTREILITYSLIAMPLAIVGVPLYIYLPTFYATSTSLDIAMVGVLIFVARLSDVFTDPYIGYLSDRSVKKYGSRKPLVLIGVFLLIFSFYFLINPIGDNLDIWLLVFSVLVYLAWSMVSIPYLTWSSEISDEYHEKTKLNSYREFFSIIGVLLALLIPYLILTDEDISYNLNILFLLFISLIIPFTIISLFKLHIKNTKIGSKFSLSDIKLIYRKIPKLKELQIGFFLNNLANAIPATLFLLFIENVIGEKELSGLILVIYFLAGVLALPLWTILSKKIGKKMVWISSIILACSAFAFVIFLQSGDIYAFALISFISGLSLGADIAFPTAMQADVVQKIKEYKDNISGLVFGLWTMITKISLALSVMITFGVLGFIGFDVENLTSESILILTLLYGLLPIVLKIIALVFIARYKEV